MLSDGRGRRSRFWVWYLLLLVGVSWLAVVGAYAVVVTVWGWVT